MKDIMGTLQGKNKAEIAKEFGKEQVQILGEEATPGNAQISAN